GRGIRRDIDDAAPVAQHAHARKDRVQLLQRRQLMFDHIHAAALAITEIAIDAGTDHQLALVGLADVNMHRTGHDDGIDNRLDRLRHQRLQRMRLYRQGKARHVGQYAGMTGHDDADLAGLDRALDCFHAGDFAAITDDAGDGTVLDDVDPGRVRGTRIPPGHTVMTCGTPTWLIG